jgi:hypothetical protein
MHTLHGKPYSNGTKSTTTERVQLAVQQTLASCTLAAAALASMVQTIRVSNASKTHQLQ